MFGKNKVYKRLKNEIYLIKFYSIYEAYNKGYINIKQRDKLLNMRSMR